MMDMLDFMIVALNLSTVQVSKKLFEVLKNFTKYNMFFPARACLANEEFKMHGTPCQITCDSYDHADEIESRCPKDIPISGCFCKQGYVRGATGNCMLPNRCPRPLVS